LWLEEPEALSRVAGTDSTINYCVLHACSLCSSGGWVVVRATSSREQDQRLQVGRAGGGVRSPALVAISRLIPPPDVRPALARPGEWRCRWPLRGVIRGIGSEVMSHRQGGMVWTCY